MSWLNLGMAVGKGTDKHKDDKDDTITLLIYQNCSREPKILSVQNNKEEGCWGCFWPFLTINPC
jgi:hypothetical protein